MYIECPLCDQEIEEDELRWRLRHGLDEHGNIACPHCGGKLQVTEIHEVHYEIEPAWEIPCSPTPISLEA